MGPKKYSCLILHSRKYSLVHLPAPSKGWCLNPKGLLTAPFSFHLAIDGGSRLSYLDISCVASPWNTLDDLGWQTLLPLGFSWMIIANIEWPWITVSTWRITQFRKWLLTMMIVRPLSRVVLLPNGLYKWLINWGVTNHLLTGIIQLQLPDLLFS